MTHKHGPVIIRMRTADRGEGTRLPSLTHVWRSAEFQEREIFDLYGVHFDGHPDLRRILMWDEFMDHPMRKNYRENPNARASRAAAHDNDFKAQRRVNGSFDGAATSIDARRLSHERRA